VVYRHRAARASPRILPSYARWPWSDPLLAPEPPGIYAAACRWKEQRRRDLFETWFHPLTVGQPLPTLPLWLDDDLAVPLDLETTYVETCRVLHLA
jgi:hypothetical protein